MNQTELLKIINISKSFGGLQALSGLDLSVKEGEIVSLIGPNGSGKTTLFNIITGVYHPTGGEVIYNGENITYRKTHEIISRGISRVFQLTSLFSDDTVLENVMAGSFSKIKLNSFEDFLNTRSAQRKRKTREERALEILRMLNMLHLKDKVASSLPYGSQRLLELAISQSAKPKLMLLDEPLCGMNPSEKIETIKLIRQIHKQDKVTMLLVEHDMKSVMDLSDRVIVLNFGEKITEGKPDEVRANQRVIEVYLGEGFVGDGKRNAP